MIRKKIPQTRRPLRTAQPADRPEWSRDVTDQRTRSPSAQAGPPGTGGRPAVHPVDEVLPAPRLIILGLQHLFIMYAGAVAVPLIVGPAVGLRRPHRDPGQRRPAGLRIATIIQSVGIGKIMGVRLPWSAGATFTVLNPMIIIANQYGLAASVRRAAGSRASSAC